MIPVDVEATTRATTRATTEFLEEEDSFVLMLS
jgi:hypothetical protein